MRQSIYPKCIGRRQQKKKNIIMYIYDNALYIYLYKPYTYLQNDSLHQERCSPSAKREALECQRGVRASWYVLHPSILEDITIYRTTRALFPFGHHIYSSASIKPKNSMVGTIIQKATAKAFYDQFARVHRNEMFATA